MKSRRVAFLLDASDYAEETSEADALRAAIDASSGFGDDWRAAFSDDFLRHAEARRTYDGTSVRALLRMLRNQSHHIRTSPFAELRTREGLLAFVLTAVPVVSAAGLRGVPRGAAFACGPAFLFGLLRGAGA